MTAVHSDQVGKCENVTCPDRKHAISYAEGNKKNIAIDLKKKIFEILLLQFYRKHLVIFVQTGTSVLLGTSERSMISCMKVVILIQFCRIRLKKKNAFSQSTYPSARSKMIASLFRHQLIISCHY